MNRVVCAVTLAAVVASAFPAWAAPQSLRLQDVSPRPAQAAGLSLLAAGLNLVYFPARLAVTLATAELGGFAAWMTGGNRDAARGVWNFTDGQAFITPAILDGRERLRFGR